MGSCGKTVIKTTMIFDEKKMASSGLTACGSQGQSIHKPFFQKSTDIDSPFACVKKNFVFQCGKAALY